MGKETLDDGRDTSVVQSLLRGLDLLRRLGAADHPLSLRELAEITGLKEPTLYKLLQTLVAAGFAEKTDRPVLYSVGPEVFDLADGYLRRSVLSRADAVVRAVFEHLYEHRATVVLAQAPAGEVEVVMRMSPERPDILQRPRGQVMQPYTSACSLAFQAFWTETERQAYRRRHPFWEEGAHLWETPEKLDEYLQRVRDTGFATPQLGGANAYLVAVPVYDPNQQFIAVLGASMREQQIAHDVWQQHITHVVQAAAELQAAQDRGDQVC